MAREQLMQIKDESTDGPVGESKACGHHQLNARSKNEDSLQTNYSINHVLINFNVHTSPSAEDNTLLYGTKYAVTTDKKLIILSVGESEQKRYR